MDTTNSSETPQRRVEDRKPEEVIDWAAPGAPAVPLSPAATSGTDDFMVYGRAGNRRADLEAKLRDALTASIPGPAAISGDAPDLQQLKALAEQVKGWANVKHVWRDSGDEAYIVGHINEDGEKYPVVVVDTQQYYEDGPALANFYAAANPAVVLGLIARIDRAERALIRAGFVDHGAQEWKPPVGPAPRFIEVPAAPATASGDELPPLPDLPRAPVNHTHLGGLFDRVQMHQYAIRYADLARAAVSAATKPTDPAKAE